MLRLGKVEYTKRNQVQIFYVIDCIEASQMTLATHLVQLFSAESILFYKCSLI